MNEHLTLIPRLEYFVCMIDYGKHYPGKQGPSGFGANVDPEHVRDDIVNEIRAAIADGHRIVQVKHVCGNDFEDVTAEIMTEAVLPVVPEVVDLQAGRFDHNQDYRKHGERV